MRDFQQMFPNVSPAHIEYVLRKYDGDVSATINELLYDNVGLFYYYCFFGTLGEEGKYTKIFKLRMETRN